MARASHEIRTLANGVVGMIELTAAGPLSREQREQLQTSLRASDRLLRRLDDLVELSRLEAGRVRLRRGAFSLRETLGAAVALLAPQATETGVELAYRVSPEVPERWVGDPRALAQVATHLIADAIETAEGGSVALRTTLERAPGAAGEPGVLRLSVRAGRPGTPGAEDARHGPRTALGRAIARRLLDLMGGRVVDPDTRRDGDHDCLVPLDAADDATGPGPLHGRRLLIVGDDPLAEEPAVDALERAGADVTRLDAATAADGMRSGRFDAIVADTRIVASRTDLLDALRTARLTGARIVWLTAAGAPGLPAGRAREDAIVARPFPPSALARACAGAADPPADGAARGGRSLSILLAEDDPVDRALAARQVQRMGHAVKAVADGTAAVEAAAGSRYDVILMDVEMPRCDGIQAADAIRREEAVTGRRTPIVAMTAHALAGDREQLLDAGMDDYLAKPFRRASLQSAIERCASAATAADPAPALTPEEEEGFLRALDGDRELLDEIARLFVADAPGHLDRLRAAIAAGDEPAARRANHTLTGSAGNFSSPEVDDSLRHLGRLLRSGALHDSSAGGRVRQALSAAERQVDRLVSQLAHLSTHRTEVGARR